MAQNKSNTESSKPGYKKTKLGWVPKDWEEVCLGDENLGIFSKGSGIAKDEIKTEGIPCIRYGEIYTTHHFIIKNIASFIGSESAEKSKRVKKNDILFTGSGETKAEIGKSVAYVWDEEVYASGDIIIFSPNEKKINSQYLSFNLNTGKSRKQLNKLGQGDSVVHIYSNHLAKIRILLPPLPEQQKIATILITWDTAIEKMDQLIAAKQRLNKGLMQQLLTGKKRFKEFVKSKEMRKTKLGWIPEDWELKRLGDLTEKFVNGGTPSTQITDYWNGNIPWITGADILDQKVAVIRRYISKEAVEKSSTNIIEKGNILLVSRTGVGKLAIAPFDIAISQDFTGIYVKKNILDKVYLFLYFNFTHRELKAQNQGTSIQGIKRETLSSFNIPLPPLSEQQKIATIFSNLDNTIEKLNNKKTSLEKQKKGLMQILLTGKKRVKL